jgi:MarR family transcriptional regulator, organic hydroperoxide resistance regulator
MRIVKRDNELTRAGIQLRWRALKIPPVVVDRLGVELDELELLHDVLTRDDRKDFR